MNVYLVRRLYDVSWCMDYAMVVIAVDAKHAERAARWKSIDFRRAKLSVTQIDITEEQVVLVSNRGA